MGRWTTIPVRSLEEDVDLVAAQLIHAAGRAAEFGIELWTESLHYYRLCWNTERAQLLADRLAGSDVGLVMDFSHIVASGGDPVDFVERFAPRIRHVHLRDAEPATATSQETSTSASATARPTSLPGCQRCRTPATPATSPSNSKPGTSPTTNARRLPPRRPASSQTSSKPHHLKFKEHHDHHPAHRRPHRSHLRSRHRLTTARRYANQGWGIVILDLDGEKSAKVAAEIGNEFNVPAFGYEIDVANEESVIAAQAAVAAEVAAGNLPPVGALANIAGITSPVPFLETTLELWNKVMAVNATGTYLVTKAFLPDMIANGWGRIVNMSSVSAQRGGGVFGKVPYSAAKAAILGFTKALAREIGDTGVTVNAITPGAVDTNIRVGSTDEQEAAINAGIPLGRNATTEEVAAVITFLSSEDSAYLTGTTIDINGGSHIH